MANASTSASVPPTDPRNETRIRLILGGDLMTGRGIDQILTHPVDPRLYESFMTDARDYVRLAERVHGPIPAPVDDAYPWGDALATMRDPSALRIVNLETSITARGEPWPDKMVHYRMHPANVGCLRAAGLDCVALANNHVLDWGYDGLLDTLDTLRAAGIRAAGAGRNLEEARAPVILEAGEGARVLVFAFATADSGVPSRWAATRVKPGVAYLPFADDEAARALGDHLRAFTSPGDVVVVSMHWGSNWGHEIPLGHRRFARTLVEEAGVALVHGHSSHHPRALEVHRGRLVLYGCGELIDDYEGIAGYERYRGDLVLLHRAVLDAASGGLLELRLRPFRLERFRLVGATLEERRWIADALARASAGCGAELRLVDGEIEVRWRDRALEVAPRLQRQRP